MRLLRDRFLLRVAKGGRPPLAIETQKTGRHNGYPGGQTNGESGGTLTLVGVTVLDADDMAFS